MKTTLFRLLNLFILILLCTASLPAADTNLPEDIRIKTATQTFNRYYYFALSGGKIYSKANRDVTGKSENWQLFLNTGLPFNKEIKNFATASSIMAIYADADELVALSDTGRFYWLRLNKGMSWNGKVWNDTWGWPEMEPLYLAGPAANCRGWSIGRRNADVLWHDDIDGNPHHFGTMGITTLYVLNKNGSEIRFTDSGLPADFSHSITLPNRGAFRAESISVSASTIFVINARGEMYTRLVDFDTIGSDPMFFKYSYIRETRNDDGRDWDSNFTEWSLPSEPWRAQPLIPLTGKAEITAAISILQNGRGNAARELRVAGTDASGIRGYYTKQVFDEQWNFVADPNVPAGKKLSAETYSPNTVNDIHYTGEIRQQNRIVSGVTVDLSNFNLAESPCSMKINDHGTIYTAKLHTVESWTYLKRVDPGRDGTPKLFFGTIELDSKKSYSNDTLKRIRKSNLKTFHYIVEATTDYIIMTERSKSTKRLQFTFSRTGKQSVSTAARRSETLTQNGFSDIANSDTLKMPSLTGLTPGDIPLLEEKIKKNNEVLGGFSAILNEYKSESKSLKKNLRIYTTLNAIFHITGTVLLNKPKIWTATRHFGAILKGYNDSYTFLYFSQKADYSKAASKIHRRINGYRRIISALKSPEGLTANGYKIYYSENFIDYFVRLGIAEGNVFCSQKTAAKTAFIAETDISPLEEDDEYFFITLGTSPDSETMKLKVTFENLPEAIDAAAKGKQITARCSITLFSVSNDEEGSALYYNMFGKHISVHKKNDTIEAELQSDGTNWELYDTSGINRNQIQIRNSDVKP